MARSRAAPSQPAATLVLFPMILLAVNTGEALDRAIDLGTAVKHARLARTTRLLTFLLLLGTGAPWAVGRRVDRAGIDGAAPTKRSLLLFGCAAAAVLLSALRPCGSCAPATRGPASTGTV